MLSAAFFRHRKIDYLPFKDKISMAISDLIKNRGVRKFYNGFRGNFDILCAKIVFDFKVDFPDMQNIMVLSYHNYSDFRLPKYFDGSVYLLEKSVLPQYAILQTNREMVLRADYIISGVRYDFGGAYTACDFARRKKKDIIDIFNI